MPKIQAKSRFDEGSEMDLAQLSEYANLALTWIGFGTVVGLIAKAVMPGRDPGGAIATVLMGIGGTLIGCAILQYFSTSVELVKPISVEGFTVGIGGAFVLLVFYKVLGGHWFVEGEQITRRARRRRQRYRQANLRDEFVPYALWSRKVCKIASRIRTQCISDPFAAVCR